MTSIDHMINWEQETLMIKKNINIFCPYNLFKLKFFFCNFASQDLFNKTHLDTGIGTVTIVRKNSESNFIINTRTAISKYRIENIFEKKKKLTTLKMFRVKKIRSKSILFCSSKIEAITFSDHFFLTIISPLNILTKSGFHEVLLKSK
ncbi:hypothetical protein BpHYR1_044231 [Brachionus plicatilis]|uniref:Uncharacterized protein n=1 Tax=Brachionus plicatilis TaxID=10195 RepID=A0A3M7SWE0_BRAPC|nr:hypothetical protein BpHYR1_044231 [Brachionus plicatilis]